ncbi:MAG TPA: nucleotide disphospho-sugar-binding domain-containing protein [Xanthobacteraceae bacterium]|nr:nucleotide disphospho-sugar-binding domain-containing protein [Xanthobacteraceae bacterium]
MARMLWLNWSGGGNLPPSLGIARVLTERGHQVAFAGRPEMVPRVKTAGFRAIEITEAYAQVDRYPQGSFLTRASCYLTSPAVEAQVRSIVAAEAPDIVLIDAMFPAALAQAPGFGRPCAVFVHTFVFRQLDMWRKMIATLDGMRQQAGFAGLPALDALWRSCERIVSTSIASFDAPAAADWDMVRHVGPVLEDEKFAVPTPLPWPESDATPLVMVSFSTGFEQRNVDKVQRALDALATEPVHVVATTGGIVAPNELASPPNAIVLNYAAHDPLMRRAALVVTHGGHGTAMRALKHGVPMVVIPGLAGDQPFVAAAVQEWGAGLALPGDATVEAIRTAARQVLATPSFKANVRQRATALAGIDGAANATDAVEALLASRQSGPIRCQQVA